MEEDRSVYEDPDGCGVQIGDTVQVRYEEDGEVLALTVVSDGQSDPSSGRINASSLSRFCPQVRKRS